MANDKHIQEVRKYISSVLLEQFGEKPTKINVTIKQPFIVAHLLDFSLPSERILIKRNEKERVWETRDLIMKDLKPKVLSNFQTITGMNCTELYADWNIEKGTGLFIAITEDKQAAHELKWPENIDKQALQEKIIETSKITEKHPDHTEMYWLDDQTILIERIGIMVEIEKQLIRNGVIEELRLAKRPLEHKVMEDLDFKSILKRDINELFIDWNFEEDKAYLVLILKD